MGNAKGLGFLFTLTLLAACLDTSLPPRPPPEQPNAQQTFDTCRGSTIAAYKKSNPNAKTLTDLANVSCQLDRKIDSAAYLTATAATVCAHSMNAYAQRLPAKVGATLVGQNGQATCAQNQSQCGYTFFIDQTTTSAALELLGPGGCSLAPDASRGVLFACCTTPTQPSVVTPTPSAPRPPIINVP